MWWLKSCPKCQGDLFSDSDPYGRYISCMQCGHHLNPVEETGLMVSAAPLGLERMSLLREEQLAA